MKKFLTLILFLAITAVAFSQSSSHMKFMGIPLNGTITQFQAKLTAKGCTYDKITSAYLPSGVRSFKGNIVGNNAIIFVNYNPKTKIVYRVKAVINNLTNNTASLKYDELKGLLSVKYTQFNTGSNDFGETVAFTADADGTESMIIGEVDLFITKDTEEWRNYPYNYNVHIDYYDLANSLKNDKQQLDDL